MTDGSTSVSIIVPTWNGRDYVSACLTSLLGQDYRDFEVIVVDNASEDGTPRIIAQGYPGVRLLCNERNLGFAGGVNVGIRASGGDIVILFNQDAVAEPGWLSAMAAGIMAKPNIGVAGCKIYLQAEKGRLWHTGTTIEPPRMQPTLRGDREMDHGQYDSVAEVECVVGAAMAVRRCVFDEIGLFDEDYFFYLEDTDLCMRARAAGYQVVYLPNAVARHHVAGSLGDTSALTFRYYHQSRLLFLLKHFDAEWFISQFVPAEMQWLRAGRNFTEYHALREAYLFTLSGLIRCSQPFRFAEKRFCGERRGMIIEGLGQLLAGLSGITQPEPIAGSWLPAQVSDPWWLVTERPFASPVPLIGPFIAWVRETWNNVSARWYVRGLLLQQMKINRRLAVSVETNERLVRELIREVVSLQHKLAETASRDGNEDSQVV
jgi:O-antigen biosynthesis protein